MKTGEEMRLFLQRLMGWGLERPWEYGGSPNGADGVFLYWRFIWAELTERTLDFHSAIGDCEDGKSLKFYNSKEGQRPSTDLKSYHRVISFWQNVDKRLGIEYPPEPEPPSGPNPITPPTHI